MKKIFYFIIAGMAIFFTACKKDNTIVENTEYEKVNAGDPKYTYLKILNLSPASPVVNFYLDGKKFSSALSSLGVENAGYGYNGVFPDLGYAVTSPGTHALTAKVQASATVNPGVEVFSTSISPAAGKYYTIVPNGTYDATNKKIPTAIVVEDTRPAALDTSKVFVRFLNMYANGPSMDVVQGTAATDPKIFSNVAVGTASTWAAVVNPGNGAAVSVKFWLYGAGTNVLINAAAGTSLTLTKGRAYTIYARGDAANTAAYPGTFSFYTTFY